MLLGGADVHPDPAAGVAAAAETPRDRSDADTAASGALGGALEPDAVGAQRRGFFALAGLATTGEAFVGAGLGAMLLILVVAVAGKLLGGAIGARLSGHGWRESFAVGSLMNARALMELIVIKVGLDAGIIGPDLFTMLLVMAIMTTVFTGPLLTLFLGRGAATGGVAVGATGDPPDGGVAERRSG